MGVTVTAAAGDNGSSDGVSAGDHADFPASDPYVLACGGTRLVSTDKVTIQSESVWNDGAQGGATGGGVSVKFPVPPINTACVRRAPTAPARRLPAAASRTLRATPTPDGYQVLVDGQRFVIGGTSAVAR